MARQHQNHARLAAPVGCRSCGAPGSEEDQDYVVRRHFLIGLVLGNLGSHTLFANFPGRYPCGKLAAGMVAQAHANDIHDGLWSENMRDVLFCMMGAALFVVPGFLWLRGSFLMMRTWNTVSGTVIGYQELQQGRHEESQGKINHQPASRSWSEPGQWTAFAPQVQFTSADGKIITFTSTMSSNKKTYHIGDVVLALYDPQSPENAEIKSFSRLFLGPVIATVVGVILLGIAVRPMFLDGQR